MNAPIIRILIAGLAGVALATTATAAAPRSKADGEAELAKLLDGRVAGKPVDCISLPSTGSSRIIEGTAIVYGSGRTLYINRPQSSADLLHDDDILVTRTFGSQLCRMDTVRLTNRFSRIPGGFVILDRFVPYKRAQPRRR
ncbi:hypothetical protein [Sphingomonas quercus]|uniref:hypothetical protein n=1 Tax=Sphingomonas quercus TaxID=2842451 RepID=UPI00209AB1AB|nr:hypothetical protein [Sphingomonas quercus]